MADLSITATEVLKGASAIVAPGICGETLAAGNVVYQDSTDENSLKLADSNHTTTAKSVVVGVMLNGGADGQPADYVTEDDDLTLGATAAPAAGQVYCLSQTAGKLCPLADITSTATGYVSVVCIGKGSGKAVLKIINSGIAKTS